MPAGLIDEDRGVSAWRDLRGDLGQVQVHRLAVAARQDERCGFAFLRADRTEDIRGCGTLVVRRRWTGSALRPTADDLVLLTDASFVGEPDLYAGRINPFFAADFFQARGKTFLKSSIAPSTC